MVDRSVVMRTAGDLIACEELTIGGLAPIVEAWLKVFHKKADFLDLENKWRAANGGEEKDPLYEQDGEIVWDFSVLLHTIVGKRFSSFLAFVRESRPVANRNELWLDIKQLVALRDKSAPHRHLGEFTEEDLAEFFRKAQRVLRTAGASDAAKKISVLQGRASDYGPAITNKAVNPAKMETRKHSKFIDEFQALTSEAQRLGGLCPLDANLVEVYRKKREQVLGSRHNIFWNDEEHWIYIEGFERPEQREVNQLPSFDFRATFEFSLAVARAKTGERITGTRWVKYSDQTVVDFICKGHSGDLYAQFLRQSDEFERQCEKLYKRLIIILESTCVRINAQRLKDCLLELKELQLSGAYYNKYEDSIVSRLQNPLIRVEHNKMRMAQYAELISDIVTVIEFSN